MEPARPLPPDAARVLSGRAAGRPLSDEEALALAGLPDGALPELLAAAGAVRDAAWGRTATFSPKVFLPITNLCRNRCGYCSFRRSPGDPGEWTMTPDEVAAVLRQGGEQGCAEALFCLGDTPESAFPSYLRRLAGWGFGSTVEYLHAAGERALAEGLLPHTNAGILTAEEMARLREVNVSLGLMLETASVRLAGPGMPHHRSPDKRPERRLAMIAEAGRLGIPMTSGILVGIGETRREQAESLLALRRLHRAHGHLQEAIVQNFRAHPDTAMGAAPEPGEAEVARAVALARLVLDDEVSVQAPPNLNPEGTALLLSAGVNDFGGISPVTPDYINPRHPWPHVGELARIVSGAGFTLRPRAPIYDRFADDPRFLDVRLAGPVERTRARLRSVASPSRLAREAARPEGLPADPGPATACDIDRPA